MSTRSNAESAIVNLFMFCFVLIAATVESHLPSPTPPAQAPKIEEHADVENNGDANSLLPPPSECGADALSFRIVGGKVAEISEYPWMALVEYRTKKNTKSLGCGASLISKRYVITAGHCVKGNVLVNLGTPISIRLGEFNKTFKVDCNPDEEKECNEGPLNVDIEATIPHPEYKPATGSQKNDIALIRIASDVTFTDFIKPICLPTSDITIENIDMNMVVAGWGATESGKSSDVKRKLTLSLVDIPRCQDAYNQNRYATELWDKQMCAGGQKGKDSCRGDSGGPLMGETNLQWTLHGIVSFGPKPCALKDIPGVYTKVISYIRWIWENMKP